VATETLLQQELTQRRLEHIKLRMKVRRLEAWLREEDPHATDPRHLQFEALQAERTELKKHAQKIQEDASRMQRSVSSSLEVGGAAGGPEGSALLVTASSAYPCWFMLQR